MFNVSFFFGNPDSVLSNAKQMVVPVCRDAAEASAGYAAGVEPC
jgi:hypothetical protein